MYRTKCNPKDISFAEKGNCDFSFVGKYLVYYLPGSFSFLYVYPDQFPYFL